MQSDGNSYNVYVVLDNSNKAYRDEDSILDQKHEMKQFGIFIMKIMNFKMIEKNYTIQAVKHIKTSTM